MNAPIAGFLRERIKSTLHRLGHEINSAEISNWCQWAATAQPDVLEVEHPEWRRLVQHCYDILRNLSVCLASTEDIPIESVQQRQVEQWEDVLNVVKVLERIDGCWAYHHSKGGSVSEVHAAAVVSLMLSASHCSCMFKLSLLQKLSSLLCRLLPDSTILQVLLESGQLHWLQQFVSIINCSYPTHQALAVAFADVLLHLYHYTLVHQREGRLPLGGVEQHQLMLKVLRCVEWVKLGKPKAPPEDSEPLSNAYTGTCVLNSSSTYNSASSGLQQYNTAPGMAHPTGLATGHLSYAMQQAVVPALPGGSWAPMGGFAHNGRQQAYHHQPAHSWPMEEGVGDNTDLLVAFGARRCVAQQQQQQLQHLDVFADPVHQPRHCWRSSPSQMHSPSLAVGALSSQDSDDPLLTARSRSLSSSASTANTTVPGVPPAVPAPLRPFRSAQFPPSGSQLSAFAATSIPNTSFTAASSSSTPAPSSLTSAISTSKCHAKNFMPAHATPVPGVPVLSVTASLPSSATDSTAFHSATPTSGHAIVSAGGLPDLPSELHCEVSMHRRRAPSLRLPPIVVDISPSAANRLQVEKTTATLSAAPHGSKPLYKWTEQDVHTWMAEWPQHLQALRKVLMQGVTDYVDVRCLWTEQQLVDKGLQQADVQGVLEQRTRLERAGREEGISPPSPNIEERAARQPSNSVAELAMQLGNIHLPRHPDVPGMLAGPSNSASCMAHSHSPSFLARPAAPIHPSHHSSRLQSTHPPPGFVGGTIPQPPRLQASGSSGSSSQSLWLDWDATLQAGTPSAHSTPSVHSTPSAHSTPSTHSTSNAHSTHARANSLALEIPHSGGDADVAGPSAPPAAESCSDGAVSVLDLGGHVLKKLPEPLLLASLELLAGPDSSHMLAPPPTVILCVQLLKHDDTPVAVKMLVAKLAVQASADPHMRSLMQQHGAMKAAVRLALRRERAQHGQQLIVLGQTLMAHLKHSGGTGTMTGTHPPSFTAAPYLSLLHVLLPPPSDPAHLPGPLNPTLPAALAALWLLSQQGMHMKAVLAHAEPDDAVLGWLLRLIPNEQVAVHTRLLAAELLTEWLDLPSVHTAVLEHNFEEVVDVVTALMESRELEEVGARLSGKIGAAAGGEHDMPASNDDAGPSASNSRERQC